MQCERCLFSLGFDRMTRPACTWRELPGSWVTLHHDVCAMVLSRSCNEDNLVPFVFWAEKMFFCSTTLPFSLCLHAHFTLLDELALRDCRVLAHQCQVNVRAGVEYSRFVIHALREPQSDVP